MNIKISKTHDASVVVRTRGKIKEGGGECELPSGGRWSKGGLLERLMDKILGEAEPAPAHTLFQTYSNQM